jgi:hypothetical protein
MDRLRKQNLICKMNLLSYARDLSFNKKFKIHKIKKLDLRIDQNIFNSNKKNNFAILNNKIYKIK